LCRYETLTTVHAAFHLNNILRSSNLHKPKSELIAKFASPFNVRRYLLNQRTVDEEYESNWFNHYRNGIECKESGFKSRSFVDLQDGIGKAYYLEFTQMSFALLHTHCLCCPEAL